MTSFGRRGIHLKTSTSQGVKLPFAQTLSCNPRERIRTIHEKTYREMTKRVSRNDETRFVECRNAYRRVTKRVSGVTNHRNAFRHFTIRVSLLRDTPVGTSQNAFRHFAIRVSPLHDTRFVTSRYAVRNALKTYFGEGQLDALRS